MALSGFVPGGSGVKQPSVLEVGACCERTFRQPALYPVYTLYSNADCVHLCLFIKVLQYCTAGMVRKREWRHCHACQVSWRRNQPYPK